jgi:hypothetical protein
MGEIIPFPIIPCLRELGADSMSEPSERVSDIHRSAELREICNAIQRVRTFVQREDIKQAARNLTDMLREAKEKGVSGAEIAREVWPKDRNPSKRFDKLTISRGRSLDEDRRIGRLQKRPGHYQKVAKVLGERVPGWSVDSALVRVFRKTCVDLELSAIVEGREARADDPEYCWRNLADMLDSLAESVSRKADLAAHLQRIAVMSGRYNLADMAIVPTYSDITSEFASRLLPHGPLADNFDIFEHFPPIPSVPIFDELLVPSFKQTLIVTSADSKDTTTLEVTVQVWREIRFAIGPVDSIDQAGSLFEARTRVEFADQKRLIELPRPWLYLDFPDDVGHKAKPEHEW